MKPFKEIIESILDDKDLIIALSDEFHISESTVKRWANGVSNPHSVIKLEVVRFIFLRELLQWQEEIEQHKPFIGIPEKDYYRGQWDAITAIIELLE